MMHAFGAALADRGDWGDMASVMREMMGPYRSGPGQVFWQFHWALELVTWALVIAVLVALLRLFWKKGGKK